jgi:hypothetical protein
VLVTSAVLQCGNLIDVDTSHTSPVGEQSLRETVETNTKRTHTFGVLDGVVLARQDQIEAGLAAGEAVGGAALQLAVAHKVDVAAPQPRLQRLRKGE